MESNELVRVFGAYWGAQVSAVFHINKIIFIPDRFDKDETGEWLKQDGSIVPLEICKLILSRLEDITDEDMGEVAKIILPDISARKSGNTTTLEMGMVMVWKLISENKISLNMGDKLRELGYDLGFGSVKSLIDAGIGVDKKSLK